jgi:hypothetical protein
MRSLGTRNRLLHRKVYGVPVDLVLGLYTLYHSASLGTMKVLILVVQGLNEVHFEPPQRIDVVMTFFLLHTVIDISLF